MREGPTLCLCVCLGQVRVFMGFAVLFLPSVGVALGREGPTLCLCVCLGQVRVFLGSAVLCLPSVGVALGCALFECVRASAVCVCVCLLPVAPLLALRGLRVLYNC